MLKTLISNELVTVRACKCGSHLAEALQHIFHLLVTSEEVSQRFFHRVEVGQGLVLLHDQLLDGVVRERLLLLVIL